MVFCHAKVARKGAAVHFFQEQLPEAMVGWDDELEHIQSGRAIQEGQAMHCAHAELTISRGSTCKILLQGCIFLLTLRNTWQPSRLESQGSQTRGN